MRDTGEKNLYEDGRMSNRTRMAIAAVAGLSMALAGCGVTVDIRGPSGPRTLTNLRLMVPNAPGGGYDITARAAAKAMDDGGIARDIEVFNLIGAGGTVGLARLVNERGNGRLAMMMGLGVVGSEHTHRSRATLTATTPLARLIEEPGIIVVSKDSPYHTLADLLAAWKADPGKIIVGGASSPGGPDHLLPMQLAKAVGVPVEEVRYAGYDSGGELLPAILGNRVGFAASGVGEYLDQIEAGALNVLAVTSDRRLAALDAPTLQEQGVDLVFANWRGLVAPPGIAESDRLALLSALDRMRATRQWQEVVRKYGWTDAYLTGQEFGAFIEKEDRRVADVLTAVGLT
jgi:putative tricarboxylic transport membrane protein